MTDLLYELRCVTNDIIQFLRSVDEEKSHRKMPPDDWSILECMEHVFISEKGIHKLLYQPELFTDEPSTKHEKIEEYKSGKFEAPEITLPRGRFSTVEEMMAAFIILRGKMETYIIEELPKAGEETYPHPILGPITKVQWIEFAIEHNQRHLSQMIKVLNRQLE